MEYQAQAMRRICDDMAGAIMSRDGSQVFNLVTRLRQAGVEDDTGHQPVTLDRLISERGRSGTGRWQFRGEPAKGKRVLWLGESAARGYFYDPVWTPAMALQGMLDDALGDRRAEVIDLAQTSIGMMPLLDLTIAAMQLQPDLCVVFAGNNWNPWYGISWNETRQVAAILAETGSWAEVKALIEQRARRQATTFVNILGELAERRQVQFVLVVPEFNLLDWQEAIRDVPFLDRAATETWLMERRRMEDALAADDYVVAGDAARHMIVLDAGTMPHGLRTAALSKLRAGASQEARRLLEQARDAEEMFPIPSAPRCSAVTQDCLRTLGLSRGFQVIDLPARFAESVPDGIPGRSMFMDYCHLTAEGLRILAASVAERVAPLIAGSRLSWQDCLQFRTQPSPESDAAAHLLAANHNFCWGQSMDVVEHHCRAAASVPAIHADIHDFVNFFGKKTPYAVSTAFAGLLRRTHVPLARYLNPVSIQPRSRERLVDAIVRSMEAKCPGMMDAVARLRMEEAITRQPANLLDGYHEERSYADFTQPSDAAIHRSYKLSSQFTFVVTKPRGIIIAMAYRTPCCDSPADTAEVILNDCVVHLAPSSARWRTERIEVSNDVIRPGVNTMRVRWPLPPVNWAERASRLCPEIDRDVAGTSSLWPVCGEIARATVVLAPEVLIS
jgi:hypothetical protein